MMSLLNSKLRKDQPFNLELIDKVLEAMERAQEKLISLQILVFQNAEGRLTVDTDGCDVQVGCVLSQE